MKTPMAMALPDIFLKGFREADEQRRAAYGDEWAARTAAHHKEQIEKAVGDPQATVDAIMRVLTLASPPSRVGTGSPSTAVIRLLKMLPDIVVDGLMYSQAFPASPPRGLAP